ncbi:MAG: guanylate kinase, partial [Deltaproteobacteria bacterium]|nr:guanylate kinase [Deltaproteobacteria bacterium]
RQLRDSYPGVVTILVMPPSFAVQKQRLIDRGTDDSRTVHRRLQKAMQEVRSMSAWYDYVVVNDSFDEAADALASIITAERCRYDRSSIERFLQDADRSEG